MSDILIKRGKESNRTSFMPLRGEPIVSFDDTTGKPRLFLGTGTDIGGIEIGTSAAHTHEESDITNLVSDLSAKEVSANKRDLIEGYTTSSAYPSTKGLAAYLHSTLYKRQGTLADVIGGTVTSYTEGVYHYTKISFSDYVRFDYLSITPNPPNSYKIKIDVSLDGTTWMFITSTFDSVGIMASNGTLVATAKHVRFGASTVDNIPSDDYTYKIQEYNISANSEKIANKVTAFQTTPDNTHYPSEKLLKDQLDYKSSFESPLCLYPTEGQVVASRIPYVITEAGSAIRYCNLSANNQILAVLQDVAWSTATADYDAYNGIIKIVSGTTIEFTDDVFVSLEATLRADSFTGSSDKFLRFAWVWADNDDVISGTNTSYIFPPTESYGYNSLPIVKVSRKFHKGNKIKLRVTGAGSTGTSTASIQKESTKCYIYEINNTSGYERDKVRTIIRKKSDSSIVWDSGEIGKTTNLIKRSMNMAYSIWDKNLCSATGNANSLGMSKITLTSNWDVSVNQRLYGYRSGDEYTLQIIVMNPTINKIKVSLEDYIGHQGIYAEFGLTDSGSIISSGTHGVDSGTLIQAQITYPQTGMYVLNIRGTPVVDTSSFKDLDSQLDLEFEDDISGEIYIGFASVKKGLYDIANNYHLLTDDANIPEPTYAKYLVGLDTMLDASENYEVIVEDVTTKGLKTSQSDIVSFSTGSS